MDSSTWALTMCSSKSGSSKWVLANRALTNGFLSDAIHGCPAVPAIRTAACRTAVPEGRPRLQATPIERGLIIFAGANDGRVDGGWRSTDLGKDPKAVEKKNTVPQVNNVEHVPDENSYQKEQGLNGGEAVCRFHSKPSWVPWSFPNQRHGKSLPVKLVRGLWANRGVQS